MQSILFFFVIINFFWGFICSELTDIVQTDKGLVQGEILETFRKSVKFSSFRGIPYGKPPVNHLRFKAPEEAEPWMDIFNATSEAIPCPQIEKIFIGNENCLNLNVYTPKINFSNSHTENLLPVMVWIYGGSFRIGYTNITLYGPDFFIEDDVVVVAMNYRLGALGFLSLNLENATGNAGLKDQLLALKWIQRNIKNFGGDSNKVTIFGLSAGAASVDYHVLSDQSQGLFHRSISMSGSPFCSWAYSVPSAAEFQAFRFARYLGITTNDKKELLTALYQQSAQSLIEAEQKMFQLEPPFKPVVENKKIAGDSGFITECAIDKYKSGNFSQLPHLTGFMANEALSFIPMLKNLMVRSMEELNEINRLNPSVNLNSSFCALAQSIGMDIKNLPDDQCQEIIDELTDIVFVAGADIKQKLISKSDASAPVYYYRNSFAPNVSLHKLVDGINKIGAAHADDKAYIWRVSIVELPTDPKDPFVIMQNRLSKMWTNFAKFSNPTPLGENDSLLNITWPVSGISGKFLEINNEFSVGERPIDLKTKALEDAAEPILAKLLKCSEN